MRKLITVLIFTVIKTVLIYSTYAQTGKPIVKLCVYLYNKLHVY